MSGLRPGQVAAMRATQRAHMPGACSIQRVSKSSDGMGGKSESESTLASNVPYRIAPSSGAEAEIAGRIDALDVWTFTLPQGTTIRAGDQITVEDGTKYHVQTTAAGSTDGAWKTALRAIATRRT